MRRGRCTFIALIPTLSHSVFISCPKGKNKYLGLFRKHMCPKKKKEEEGI
jgi:hypothetical protein